MYFDNLGKMINFSTSNNVRFQKICELLSLKQMKTQSLCMVAVYKTQISLTACILNVIYYFFLINMKDGKHSVVDYMII